MYFSFCFTYVHKIQAETNEFNKNHAIYRCRCRRETNSTRFYHVEVEEDHENEICEMQLSNSPTNQQVLLSLSRMAFMETYVNSTISISLSHAKTSPKCKQEFKDCKYIPELKYIKCTSLLKI